jgi:signal transduction histidine kinase
MRHSLIRKLSLTNALTLFVAMLLFCGIAIFEYGQSMYSDICKQLIVENKAASIIAKAGRNEPLLYKTLSNSTNLVYKKSTKSNTFELVYASDKDLDFPVRIEELLQIFIETKQKVIDLSIGERDYLCAVTAVRLDQDGTNGVVVSLISADKIKQTAESSIIIMVEAFVLLLAISSLISGLLFRRITKPIAIITELTKRYAKRDFAETYTANTKDEIYDLSVAVSKMADSLQSQDEERDKMFRQISHEIKTPLTTIYGYAEGLKTGAFENIDEPAEAIMRESLRIQKITENIILLSKLESKVEMFAFAEHNISEIVERAIECIESLAIIKDIDIIYTPHEIDQIYLDAEKMQCALTNILSNCIKYAKDCITIEVLDSDDAVKIIISDNGKGFDVEHIGDLLSGLSRVKSNGSGIGLSIVNEIVKAHGGRFNVGNKSIGGAEFSIILKK